MKTNLLIAIACFAAMAALAAKPQTKSWANKDARFFVQHFERNDHGDEKITVSDSGGIFETDDTVGDFVLNWDDGKGGKETFNGTQTIDNAYYGYFEFTNETVNIWPQTWWPTLVNGTATDSDGDPDPHPPGMIYEHKDLKFKQNWALLDGPNYEEGHKDSAAHTQIVLKFYAGGKGLPKRPSVYQGSVSVFSHKQTGVSNPYDTPVYDSISVTQNITLGDLGSLDPDGILYAKIEDESTKDITPKVANVPYYTFGWPVLTKYTLISQVSCPALTDTNLERTSLGVAEVVSLGTMPAETTWSTTAGTLSSSSGSGIYLYAPHTAGSATVKATIRKVTLSIDFGVVEPSGVSSTVRARDFFAPPGVGAGMQLDVVVQPTSVSFSQIEVEEPGQTATGLTGYFTSHTPPNHDTSHGANAWHPVTCGNLISDNLFDNASSFGWPIGVSGSYTWPISPIWRVVGDSATHSLSGWTDQIMTLSSDGTMRVDKLGHNVIRHTSENYGIAQ